MCEALEAVTIGQTPAPQIVKQLQHWVKTLPVTQAAESIIGAITEKNINIPPLSGSTSMLLDNDERVLRINAERLNRIMGLSSELMVETRRLQPLSNSMLALKRRYSEVSNILEKLREGLGTTAVAESNISMVTEAQKKLSACRSALSERIIELDDYERRKNNLTTQVYNEVIASRMRPFSDCTQGLQRMARDVARSLGKEVKLEIKGLNTSVDRDVLETLKAPLNHIVRNAIDHGIETPEIRQSLDKATQGKIEIQAHHYRGRLQITVEDDGAGIDLQQLKKKIINNGLIVEELLDNLSQTEMFEFLFLPNFSTRKHVSEISGRGVGLDVVRDAVQGLRGDVSIHSTIHFGTKITIHLPLSISVMSVLLVEIAQEPYAFPLARVERLTQIDDAQILSQQGIQYVEIGGENIAVVSAARLLNLEGNIETNQSIPVIVLSEHDKKYALIVDRYRGRRELSVQTLDSRLGKIQDISAAAITDEGQPVLIIDVDDIIRSLEKEISGSSTRLEGHEIAARADDQRKRILVVDDSLTVRQTEKKLLEKQGYIVDVALDGVDACNMIRRQKYQLIITDVDMPRMDGIELVRTLKKDLRTKSMPVVIVSYKNRPDDKFHGLEAGADYYMTKESLDDNELTEAVVDLIGEAEK
ncbi:response regulator [Kaarinaea lacus]